MTPAAIHQFHAGSGYGDGVTNSMLFIQRILRSAGYRSEIYTADVDPRLSQRLRSFDTFANRLDELLLVHYSHGHQHHDWIEQCKGPRVLIYHSITPSHFFAPGSDIRRYADLGRQQLATWARSGIFTGAIAVSLSNAAELSAFGYSRSATIPLLVDLDHIRGHVWNRDVPVRFADSRNVMFLGRLCEHKGQVELVQMMARLVEMCDLPTRLLLPGSTTSSDYLAAVQDEIERNGLADRVVLLGRCDDADVYGLYRAADLYVSLSQHEGFGMPLVEAMAFDVPVLAFDAGNVADTLGGGGVIAGTREPESVAAAAKLLLEEPWLRREVLLSQRKALARYERPALVEVLQAYLGTLGFDISLEKARRGDGGRTDPIGLWCLEGPFDSSYSLAVVNRSLARALAQEGETIGLVSRDGPGPLTPSQFFLASNPDIEAMWTLSSEGWLPDVTLRNLYPPNVSDTRGLVRGLACYAWEESGFSAEHRRAFNAALDVITVTSTFVAKTLRDNGVRAPLRVVGNGIDHILDASSTARPTHDLGQGFRFLHVSSCFPRKGIDALLAAWSHAFSKADGVVLVIKTFPNPHNTVTEQIAELDRLQPDHAPIILINEDLDPSQIRALYTAADAVVCPSRGEGFGLPLAEALALGKPVITTAFGGQSDFCTPETAWLCDYRFAYARSHLEIPASVWVEPDIDSLVECLRTVRSATPANLNRRARAGQDLVRQQYTWRAVAGRLRDAVADLDKLDSRALRLPRIGWVSTWNSRCGIATYSEALTRGIAPENLVIFATRNCTPIGPDPDNVIRCWDEGWSDPLDDLYAAIRAAHVDAVVIQFNFGFFRLAAFAALIERLTEDGIAVYPCLHSTADVDKPDVTIHLRDAMPALAKARRILVHSVNDLNRLKALGLVANTVLFPHGLPMAYEGDRRQARRALRLDGKRVIGSFGFLLPHKGLRELIEATAALRRADGRYHLLMLNALYPGSESRGEHEACRQLIDRLGLAQHVTLITDFLDEATILAKLAAADVVVFPYQDTQESASGAVRLGLASSTPVAATPLPIFDDVSAVVERLPGCGPREIAAGIERLLADSRRLEELRAAQRNWVKALSWDELSMRLDGLIRGEYVDTIMNDASDGVGDRAGRTELDAEASEYLSYMHRT
ncbi:glycosyltransferase [Inquilinus limosus]|uniref:glycosyltransferase family 4 protein n=1 Tax=Inquilinus limosus TaxID=171674 RepID=UPI003F14C4D0